MAADVYNAIIDFTMINYETFEKSKGLIKRPE